MNGQTPGNSKLLETKLIQEEIENLTRPKTSREIELVIKNFLQRKAQIHIASVMKYKEWLTPILHKLFQKPEEEKALSKSFCEASYPDTKTSQKTTQEKYRPISIMSSNTNILNKILANWIQQRVRIIHHDQAM